MRIVHFSDVHIGVENYGRIDPETGLSTRLLDFLATFDEVVDYAVNNQVDLALFCGDAYKSRDPSQTHQREFARRIARMSAAGIPVFLVVGNHDMPHVASRATALEIYRTLEVPNVFTADVLGTTIVPTAGGDVQIVAVPWIRRGAFLSRDDTRGMSPEEINTAIEERLTQAIRYQADALDPNTPALFAGHVSVSQARLGSEQSMMLGQDHVLLNSAVGLPQFDYVALGHIHRHQVFPGEPRVVYSGSLERVDFGEEKDDKGFCVIDLDPGRPAGQRVVGFEFKPVDARSFVTVEVGLKPDDLDPTGTIINAIQGHYVDDAIVRVQVQVPGELEGFVREPDIREALADAHYIASISVVVEREARVRLGERNAQGLEPREALKVYLKTRNVSADRAKTLLQRAEQLMQEPAED